MIKGTAPFTNAEAEVLRAGHIMGIKRGMKIKLMPELQSFISKTEGNYHPTAFRYVVEKLQGYQPTDHQEQWQEIREIFQIGLNEADSILNDINGLDLCAQNQFHRYQDQKLVYVGAGWDIDVPSSEPQYSHHIGVTFYKGYMIVTNRGLEGVENQGSVIYKLSREITEEDLKTLQKHFQKGEAGKKVSFDEIQAKLKELQGEKVASLPQKDQKYGTCSYVNKLSAIEGILCLLTLEKQGKLNDESIKAYTENNQNRRAYKDFTNASRELEVDRIVALINQASASNNKHQLTVLVNIALSIAWNHQGKTRDLQKNKAEIARAKRLLDAVDPHKDSLTSLKKDTYESFKRLIDVRTAFIMADLSVETIPSQLKDKIMQKLEKLVSAKTPMWHAVLSVQMMNAKTYQEIENAFEKAFSRSSDDELVNLYYDIRQLLMKEVPALQKPLMPSKEKPELDEQSTKTVPITLAMRSDFHERVTAAMFDNVNVLTAFSPAEWLRRLTKLLTSATDFNEIATHLNMSLQSYPKDAKLNSMIDVCFQSAIAHARDLEELIAIIQMYPKDIIVSPSGTQYECKEVIEQLNMPQPWRERDITAALGIRNKAMSLQASAQNKPLLAGHKLSKRSSNMENEMPEAPKSEGQRESKLRSPKGKRGKA